MASVSVLNCFEVLVNGNETLIESNLTIFDLAWNWVFGNLSIFETVAIGWDMAILYNILGYFKTINSILSSFYGFDTLCNMYTNDDQCIRNPYCYQTHIIMMKVQYIIIILILMYEIRMTMLLLFDYFFYVFSKMEIVFAMKIESNNYHSGILCNVLCENFNYTIFN